MLVVIVLVVVVVVFVVVVLVALGFGLGVDGGKRSSREHVAIVGFRCCFEV